MKAFHIPFYNSNPYQELLIKGLNQMGLECIPVEKMPLFTIFLNIKKEGKPDIIHLHWLYPFLISNTRIVTLIKSFLTILELLIVKILGIRIICTVHNLYNHEKKYLKIETFFRKIILNRCDYHIVHSVLVKEIFKRFYNIQNDKKIVVIPHGNYIGYYKNSISKWEARKELNIDQHSMIFLNFGIIRKYKGIVQLIDTFKSMKYSQFKLLIVGKPYTDRLKEEVLKCTQNDINIKTYLYFIPDDKVQIFFNASDVVVLPYENSLTSGAAILAMSFKKAVIASASGFLKEIMDPKVNFLYEQKSAAGLEVMMNKAYEMHNQLEMFGEKNYQAVLQFDWKMIALETTKIYQLSLRKI